MTGMIRHTTRPKAIILIPAYQPGRMLIDSTRQLLAADVSVVVVDDGSGQDYAHIFNALDTRVHVLRHGLNQGKGAALKTGYAYIRATFRRYIIVTADADGQHAVSDIKNMIDVYPHHPHTLLLGTRVFEQSHVPLKSRVGNTLTRKVFSLITQQRLSDTQTGLRAFDDSLVDMMLDVSGERFEYETNVLLACTNVGVDMVELPIQTIYVNRNDTSHFDPIRDSFAIYKELIKFASSSLLSFGIDFVLFLVLVQLTSSWELMASVMFANIVARVVSASVNFSVNRRLVFTHTTSFAKGALRYFLLACGILVGNTFLLTFLTSVVGIQPSVAKIITEITLFILSYVVQKKVVFVHQEARHAR